MQQVLCIAAFGALGCLSRYFLSGFVYKICGNTFPYGTLVVNLIGAFLIGLIMEFSLRSALIDPVLRISLTVGFLGGLTTFSTFSLESFRLLEEGQFLVAFSNMMLSVIACLACTWLGVAAARSL